MTRELHAQYMMTFGSKTRDEEYKKYDARPDSVPKVKTSFACTCVCAFSFGYSKNQHYKIGMPTKRQNMSVGVGVLAT